MLRLSLLLAFLAMVPTTFAKQFTHWFPQFGNKLSSTLHNNCSTAYEQFLGHIPNSCPPDSVQCVQGLVVECILSNVGEAPKANMAAAAVVLGLLPTVLGFIGSNTAETGILAVRRPFLALLIATGAPAVSPIRTFEYRSPLEILKQHGDTVDLPRLGKASSNAVLLAEYLLACVSIANLAFGSWQLSIYTVCSFAMDDDFHPLLWAFIAIAIHIAGAVAVVLRISIQDFDEHLSLASIWGNEFRLCAKQKKSQLRVKRESYLFIVVSYCTSLGTILHIIYGTMVFSSILFISTADALLVAVRLLASAIVCRMILMFELWGMRATVTTDLYDDEIEMVE